jgi:hypothetical protein
MSNATNICIPTTKPCGDVDPVNARGGGESS